MVHFHAIDYTVIALYFTITTVIGLFIRSKQTRTAEEYILVGRRLTLPGFVATLVTTWYGGILGIGEFTYRYGVVNWVTQGFFFYVFAAVFALFLAKRIQKAAVFTIPDLLEQSYGRHAALAGALFTFLMVSPAPYILILGILINVVFGWSLFACIVIGTVFSSIYLLAGGFKAVIRTDMFQFFLMFGGFFIIVPAAVFHYGGLGYLRLHLPETHLTVTGELGAGYILVWGFIALWTLVDPGFYQRCLAAQDGKTARRGIVAAIGFWMIFDLLTLTAGLYARAALPGIEPLMAFPLLAEELLPTLWKGLFFTGMLATVMSTVDSFTFLSALTIGNDFIGRIRGGGASRTIKRYTQLGLVLTAAGSILIAWWSRSVIAIWYTIGTIGIPALLLPVLSSYSHKYIMRRIPALVSMLAASGTSAVWLLWGSMHTAGGYPAYPLGLEPMYPGLAVSLIVYAYNCLSNTAAGRASPRP